MEIKIKLTSMNSDVAIGRAVVEYDGGNIKYVYKFDGALINFSLKYVDYLNGKLPCDIEAVEIEKAIEAKLKEDLTCV